MSNDPNVRRPKTDPADAQDSKETFLPGQIPVKEAESQEAETARRNEQQPDPVSAEKAVNPETTPAEDRKPGER
jgi:hypothetical protein